MKRIATTELEPAIQSLVDQEKILSFKTYILSDRGEAILKLIASTILRKYDRMDLMDIVYTAAKELIINATKANLKRVLFREVGLNPADLSEYQKGMMLFKDRLNHDRIENYRDRFRDLDFPVIATFYYNAEVMHIKVKNMFTLLDFEEGRIRKKFEAARSFKSLLDFYTEFGDDSEGAGLGLTMVGILLDESGIDKHAFTVYSNEFRETAARLEIPLSDKYVPKRNHFERELQESGMPREKLRRVYAHRSFF
jgi:hypothetical protein